MHISYEVYIYRMRCEISNFSGIFVQMVPHIMVRIYVHIHNCCHDMTLLMSQRFMSQYDICHDILKVDKEDYC